MRRECSKNDRKDRFRRGIYLLPNLCTTLNMFCGFYAIISAIDGKFIPAAYAIVVAGIFDILDGKIARATRSTSKFGVEFDSLADLISFGIAPGVMMYLWALNPLGRIGWLTAFLFVVCGALRLARFNTQVGVVSSDYFVGLPIPAGAGITAVTVLFCHKLGMEDAVHPFSFLVLFYVLSFLMVSTIPYSSFKKVELLRDRPFNILVTAILILIFIAAQPSVALFFIGIMYLISGPIIGIRQYRKSRHTVDETDVSPDEERRPNLV